MSFNHLHDNHTLQRKIFVASDKAAREYHQQNPSKHRFVVAIWEAMSLAAEALV